MRKRTIFLFVLVAVSVIVQLPGIPYLGITLSTHDIEFDYTYNWNVLGTGGYYVGYTEEFQATGHYEVDFIGDRADVVASINWQFAARYEGYLEDYDSAKEMYTFSYSLEDGSYLTGTDQEFNTSGMNVWFHIPGGVTGDSYELLGIPYEFTGDGLIWLGFLMPFTGKRLYSAGEYQRDDAYGQFTSRYTFEDFFTSEGYFIGEIYHETNEGTSDGHWSTFNLDSYIFVTTSNYLRPFNVFVYLLAYWFPFLIIVILLYVVYEHYRWRPKSHETNKDIIIEKDLPFAIKPVLKSPYSGLINAYIARAKAQDKSIITAHNSNELLGIGFIEEDGTIGSFFGEYIDEIIKFANVKFAFAERKKIPGYKVVDKFDIFKIENLQVNSYNFDASLIRPAMEEDLNPIMRLISNEDAGKRKEKYAKWVLDAVKSDLVVCAAAQTSESWIRTILNDIVKRNYPKPEIYGDKILLGVGFATPAEKVGWLYGLYVHPAFRNQGIGRSIVNARLSILKELGCITAITEIAEWNSPAKNIYDDLDSEELGKITLFGKKMPKVKVRRF